MTPTYDEDLIEDPVATLTHSASGGGYGNVTIPAVRVRVEDLYERGIQLLWYHTTVYEQHSSGGSYGVVMSGPPAGRCPVTVTIVVPPGLNLSVTPQTLRFTANNWRPAKSVIVRQGNDGNAEHERVQFTHTATTAPGDNFESDTIPSIELLLVDDDNEGLPGRPRDVRGTSGEGSVGLKWTPPLEDPEKPVLNYEYQQDGETGWTPTGDAGDDEGGDGPHQRRELQVPGARGELGGDGIGVGAVCAGDAGGAGADRRIHVGAVVA